MGLDVPDLDDRSYEELLEDMRKRIPVHAESWTDHNAHDPGITILELLAFLAETHVYQLDQVSDAHRRKYLELVDEAPEPPQRATVTVSVSVRARPGDAAARGEHAVAPGAELFAETAAGRTERFRTTDAVHCSATAIAAVVADHGDGRTDHTRANDSDGLFYRPFGDNPESGDSVYLGFEGDPFASPHLDLWVDFHEATVPAPASHGDEPVEFDPSLRCVWEHCVDPGSWYRDSAWEPTVPDHDETIALYRGGRIRLSRPDGWTHDPVRILGHDRDRFWLRCRLARLPGQNAPEPRYELPPQVNEIDVNVVRARHERRIEAEAVGSQPPRNRTTAEPNQQFDLDAAPVQSASVSVGGEPWETVADFDESTGDDAHVRLDPAAGRLTFGDGRRGAIPPPGERIEADYVAGGGAAGNLPADTTWQFAAVVLADDLAVEATAPPSGGREAESIDAALARARAQREVPFRAVTAADHVTIATHTPGLRFGRAAVASAPGDSQPVTVVVLPYSPPDRLPVPSEGFLGAVEAHLCRHALLTERVRVVGPSYVPINVQSTIEPVAGSDHDALRRAVHEAVEDFLDPLSGFDGGGWPFGRPVYRSELYEVLETMDRVADAVNVDIESRGDVAIEARGDTLPRLLGVSVDVLDERDACGRGP